MTEVAIVTGAYGGIGQAIALRLAQQPETVVICADIQGATETATQIAAAGGKAVSRMLDVTNRAQWQELAADVIAEYGRIDYLAASAGVVNRLSLDTVVDLTEEAWDQVMDVDAKGVWLGMQAVIPQMIAQGGGHIVNISSLAATKGLQGLASYTAAKGAVEALTRQAAAEYGRRGVLVNVVAPGTIETTINAATLADPAGASASIATTTIGRWAQPRELAAMVVALLREGSFVSGQVIHVDGGWSISGGIDYQDSRTM
ncbi:MAG: SDR family oxidoreductase [Promicromonosporaceae bacterium]|nr:SDR family oxidoreductase [Promicromonosporaceae bacterium]